MSYDKLKTELIQSVKSHGWANDFVEPTIEGINTVDGILQRLFRKSFEPGHPGFRNSIERADECLIWRELKTRLELCSVAPAWDRVRASYRRRLSDPKNFTGAKQEIDVASDLLALEEKVEFIPRSSAGKTSDLKVKKGKDTFDIEITTISQSPEADKAFDQVSTFLEKERLDTETRYLIKCERFYSEKHTKDLNRFFSSLNQKAQKKGQLIVETDKPGVVMVVAPASHGDQVDKWWENNLPSWRDLFAENRWVMGHSLGDVKIGTVISAPFEASANASRINKIIECEQKQLDKGLPGLLIIFCRELLYDDLCSELVDRCIETLYEYNHVLGVAIVGEPGKAEPGGFKSDDKKEYLLLRTGSRSNRVPARDVLLLKNRFSSHKYSLNNVINLTESIRTPIIDWEADIFRP